jgi:hypothetical protein
LLTRSIRDMRFAVLDDSDSDESSLPVYTSEEDSPAPVRRSRPLIHASSPKRRPRRSQPIRAYSDSSSDEHPVHHSDSGKSYDSEDAVGEALENFEEILTIGAKDKGEERYARDIDSISNLRRAGKEAEASTSRLSTKDEKSATAWRDGNDRSRRPSFRRKRSAPVPFEDVTREQASEHDIWVRSTEEAAMVRPNHLTQ